MLPIHGWPSVEEAGDRRGYLLRRITRIRPGRSSEGYLFEEIAEVEVTLRAAPDAIEWVGRILVGGVGSIISRCSVIPFKNRPTEVQAGRSGDTQPLPREIANHANIKHTRIAIY